MPHYTQEQIEKANRTDLVAFLQNHGETVKQNGASYYWKKHQVWLRDHRWYSHYESVGGYPIGFVMRYFGMGFQDAIAVLLGCTTYGVRLERDKNLVIPERNQTMDRVFAYLMQKRFISRDVIAHFAHQKTLYEDTKYHNCIFVGTDEEGNPRHIHRRGTQGTFKHTEPGSEAEYSFHHDGTSDTLYVFEAPIDMLAFITLHPENWRQHSYVALCSVSERAVLHRLRVNPNLQKIVLCLDRDNAGTMACYRIKDILNAQDYDDVQILQPENKDWDEDSKAQHGVPPSRGEADESKAIFDLCNDFICIAKRTKKPPHLFPKVFAVFASITNRATKSDQKQIDQLIVLLLLLSMDECRKSLKEASWNEIAEKLMAQYVPHADNGNTEMRLRQIGNDMENIARVYAFPNMTYDVDLFLNPILRVAMDCIRLTNYLEKRK